MKRFGESKDSSYLYHVIINKNKVMTNERENAIDLIKEIIWDYNYGGTYWLEINSDDVDKIAKRIVTDLMGLRDDNEYVNLIDLTKKQ